MLGYDFVMIITIYCLYILENIQAHFNFKKMLLIDALSVVSRTLLAQNVAIEVLGCFIVLQNNTLLKTPDSLFITSPVLMKI